MGLGGILKKVFTLGQAGKNKSGNGMKDALNSELGYFDNTTQPQAAQAYGNYNDQFGANSAQIAGLFDPNSAYGQVGSAFDKGLDTYDSRINDMYTNAGYTPEEKQGQRTATEAGFAAPYAAANDAMKLNQVRTGQSAGVANNMAKLARDRGQMISAGLGGLEKGFGDARIQGQQSAMNLSQFPQQARLQRMSGMQGAIGVGQNQANQALGAYQAGLGGLTSATGIRAANVANNPSFLKQLGSSVAGGIGGAIGNIGKKP
jgi:hypothetical protein